MIGPLVGRQGEVAILEQWFQRAARVIRQLGFVSGEAGIGQDDNGRSLSGPSHGQGRRVGRAGSMRRALWRGENRTCHC